MTEQNRYDRLLAMGIAPDLAALLVRDGVTIAAEAGSTGGKARSSIKSATARLNGKKGGRPPQGRSGLR